MAEQLSADPSCQVTLLEVGPAADAPGVHALLSDAALLPIQPDSPVATRFESTLTDTPTRQSSLVRGAVVGGSGAINGGYFCRAAPADFEAWELADWAWSDVLPHYRAIETDLDQIGPDHGDSGPIQVRRTTEFSSVTTEFIRRSAERGLPWISDLSAEVATGVGAVPLNVTAGRVRMGPGAAFLAPAVGRPNLTVQTGVRARVLQFGRSGGGLRVTGVEVETPVGMRVLSADRIILCCGAIGSSMLLMHSGIGPESVLHDVGIRAREVLPVGMRCTDHPEWLLSTRSSSAVDAVPLEVVATVLPDVEIRPYTTGFGAMTGRSADGEAPYVGVALMRPHGHGRITLASADRAAAPRIEQRYDSDPRDVHRLAEGAALAADIMGDNIRPADPLWATSQHLSGTAPMGRDDDPAAVLDSRCRVRGIEGLWVIDGASLPSVPSRGPHATIVMLAHRAAGFVTR